MHMTLNVVQGIYVKKKKKVNKISEIPSSDNLSDGGISLVQTIASLLKHLKVLIDKMMSKFGQLCLCILPS